jgi:hypothetical protein
MAKANIRDRASIERVYPPDAFAGDAAHNDRAATELHKGVRIVSAPDEAGDFALERTARHLGEAPDAAVFLVPFHRATAAEHAAADLDSRHGYEAFLDDIIAAARRRGYRAETSPGRGEDPRIRGARQ